MPLPFLSFPRALAPVPVPVPEIPGAPDSLDSVEQAWWGNLKRAHQEARSKLREIKVVILYGPESEKSSALIGCWSVHIWMIRIAHPDRSRQRYHFELICTQIKLLAFEWLFIVRVISKSNDKSYFNYSLRPPSIPWARFVSLRTYQSVHNIHVSSFGHRKSQIQEIGKTLEIRHSHPLEQSISLVLQIIQIRGEYTISCDLISQASSAVKFRYH